MKKVLPQIIRFLVFTLLLAVGPLCLMYTGNKNWIGPQFWMMFSFIGFLTLTTIVGVLISQIMIPEFYAQIFLGATVFKMLACLVFMLVLVLKTKVDKTVFMVDFFYLYFLNMGFEVYVLLRNLRNQNLK